MSVLQICLLSIPVILVFAGTSVKPLGRKFRQTKDIHATMHLFANLTIHKFLILQMVPTITNKLNCALRSPHFLTFRYHWLAIGPDRLHVKHLRTELTCANWFEYGTRFTGLFFDLCYGFHWLAESAWGIPMDQFAPKNNMNSFLKESSTQSWQSDRNCHSEYSLWWSTTLLFMWM